MSRFDIVEAWYVYCSLHHQGQVSWLYRRLSRIIDKMKFRPRRSLNGPNTLTNEGRKVYNDILAKREGENR